MPHFPGHDNFPDGLENEFAPYLRANKTKIILSKERRGIYFDFIRNPALSQAEVTDSAEWPLQNPRLLVISTGPATLSCRMATYTGRREACFQPSMLSWRATRSVSLQIRTRHTIMSRYAKSIIRFKNTIMVSPRQSYGG